MKELVTKLCNEVDGLTDMILKSNVSKENVQKTDSVTFEMLQRSLELIETSKSVVVAEAIMLDNINCKLDLLLNQNKKTES